jgi:hypothetical protein
MVVQAMDDLRNGLRRVPGARKMAKPAAKRITGAACNASPAEQDSLTEIFRTTAPVVPEVGQSDFKENTRVGR